MKIMLRSAPVLVFLAATLTACGGGGGGGDGGNPAPASEPPPSTTPPPSTPPPNTPPATISNVTIDKLAGTWYGTFDRKGSMVSIKFTVSPSGTDITLDEVDGQPSDLKGTVTKDGLTSFRFAIANPTNTQQNHGVLITDQATDYLIFISDAPSDREFAVLQRQTNAAAQLETHSQTALNGAWNGHTSVVGNSLTGLQPKGSAADCAPAGAPAGPTACKVTLSDRTRSVPAYTLSDPRGRWQDGNYTDTVPNSAPQNGTTQAYISQDGKFIGAWACANSASFPANCDFSAWTKR